MELYKDEIFIFTPKGDLYRLPKGATVLDFAFGIHTGLGCKCTGALVNGRNVPIRHVLCNGDQVLFGSLVGLIITIPSIFVLIPMYGIVGAGISVSLTYLGTILYQWFVFRKITGTRTIELVPTLNDFKTLMNSIKLQIFKQDC